ncbi:actin nucleation-promoting factor WASL [Eupeodes corollae]|uniref:actin nucleation-promoting factor WASL n=1 Tax=Eupeodes corollae TaxID=290404 RepID=UPI0024924E67|nr:actin nucleation-promoting factor WASL [Eupeodes corollae]
MNKTMKQQMSSSAAGSEGGGGGGGVGGGVERQKINSSSDLLTTSENETVFGLLGRRCQSMSTAVVQIYKTEGSAHSHWKKKHTGVVCFVKDSCIRSYFFRAYCLIKNELIWEHEVYESLKLNKARPFLLTFEGQDGNVGLNFVSETECDNFYRIVEATMETRNRKRQERRQRSRLTSAPPSVPNAKNNKLQLQPAATNVSNSDDRVQMRNHSTAKIPTSQPKATFLSSGFSLLSNNKDKKPKYKKSDISNPTNFVHISHVGWDVNNGFDTHGTEEDKKLTNFLNKAGVSENHMNDRGTREFIYEFIQTNKVFEVEAEKVEEPKAPEPAPPPIPSRQNQLPQNGTSQRSAPPPPPARQPPPPVPTTTPRGKVPQPPSRLPPVQTIVTAPAAPPPPPPPPPPVAPPPPPMPTATDAPSVTSNTLKPPAPAVPVVNDTRSALMDSIRKGTTLKKVDTSTLSTGSGDSRSELLSEIRSGIELRPVESRELAPASNRVSDESCGTDALADALRRALQERGPYVQLSDDDDSDQSSENDGEWDD